MKNVILFGDSIRMQYQEPVGKRLADIANIYGPDENDRWSGYVLNSLRFWLPSFPTPDLVQWNAGLYGFGTVSKTMIWRKIFRAKISG